MEAISEEKQKSKIRKSKEIKELPKIDQNQMAYSLISPISRKKVNITLPEGSSYSKSKNKLNTEPNHSNSKNYFFRDQTDSNKKKEYSSEISEKKFLSFFNSKIIDQSGWKQEELIKWKKFKEMNDFTNSIINNEKKNKKNQSLENNVVTKSSLNHVDFNKLSKTQTKFFPIPEITEEKIKENLKDHIGATQYPIDYKEINFEIPKKNFITFEPLKTFMSSFKQSFDKRSFFEFFMIIFSSKRNFL